MSWNRRLMLAEAVKGGEMELDYLTIIAERGMVTIGLETWCYMEDDGSWVYAEILGSPDGGVTWYNMPIAQGFAIPQGEKLLLKANYYDFITENSSKFGNNTYPARIVCLEGQFSVEGTPLSLAHGDDFKTRRELTYSMFDSLFNAYDTPVHGLIRINNPESFLPSTELFPGCYSGMFGSCSELKNAPALPATALAPWCYDNMFYGCTSLIEAPELPATELWENCYSFMFTDCLNLIHAPELPATTLAEHCYSGMFDGCVNLVAAPVLPATELAVSCYSYMFSGCTNLVTAPVLPATILAEYCYSYMFSECSSLINVPALPATILAEWCCYRMFYRCTSLATAPVLPAETLVSDCYSSMFEECGNLNYIEAMFTTRPSTDYTYNWVKGVASTGTFVKNKNATWDALGSYGIPSGWTVKTK